MLKLILTVLLFVFALLMLKPVKGKTDEAVKTGWKFWNIKSSDNTIVYPVNLLIVVPTVLVFGFIVGMVGVSGGSFMVLYLYWHVAYL